MKFSWRTSKPNFLQIDIHSHLIPDIDDGVKSWDDALIIVTKLSQLGFRKLITTPHIIHDYYPNTPALIKDKVRQLNQMIKDNNLSIEVEAGAEYLVDEHFVQTLQDQEELLTFGDGYILIETPFMNKPLFLEEVIFDLQSRDLKPILAHPERYAYLQGDMEQIDHLHALGLLFQVNISSLTGYYSSVAKKVAKSLIDQKMVHFLGSDIHHQKHMNETSKALQSSLFDRCRQLNLLNASL